jgi:hypothetical protein
LTSPPLWVRQDRKLRGPTLARVHYCAHLCALGSSLPTAKRTATSAGRRVGWGFPATRSIALSGRHGVTVWHFKASMTCPNGHGLTLRGHSIASNGDVAPSVVCPDRGCAFHAFVRLERWSFGAIP